MYLQCENETALVKTSSINFMTRGFDDLTLSYL